MSIPSRMPVNKPRRSIAGGWGWLAFFIVLVPVGCAGPLALILLVTNETAKAALGYTSIALFMIGLTGTALMAWDLIRSKHRGILGVPEPADQPRVHWKGALLVTGLMAMAGGAIFVYGQINEAKIDAVTQPHQHLIDKVLSGPLPAARVGPPFGSRRLLLVNTASKKVDWLFFDLPASMRANTPEEVGLVVLLTAENRKVGQYGNGKPAYQTVVRAKFIDLETNASAPDKEFLGDEPPGSIPSRASMGIGRPPNAAIVEYLVESFR